MNNDTPRTYGFARYTLEEMKRIFINTHPGRYVLDLIAHIEELEAKLREAEEWSVAAYNLINRIDPVNAQDANDQAGLLTSHRRLAALDKEQAHD